MRSHPIISSQALDIALVVASTYHAIVGSYRYLVLDMLLARVAPLTPFLMPLTPALASDLGPLTPLTLQPWASYASCASWLSFCEKRPV